MNSVPAHSPGEIPSNTAGSNRRRRRSRRRGGPSTPAGWFFEHWTWKVRLAAILIALLAAALVPFLLSFMDRHATGGMVPTDFSGQP